MGATPAEIEVMPPLNEDAITQTIKTLLETAWGDISPQEINSGQCADFAEDVVRLLKDGGYTEATWDWIPDMAHAAIPFQGKWYDAESPNGALATDLPFWKREKAEAV